MDRRRHRPLRRAVGVARDQRDLEPACGQVRGRDRRRCARARRSRAAETPSARRRRRGAAASPVPVRAARGRALDRGRRRRRVELASAARLAPPRASRRRSVSHLRAAAAHRRASSSGASTAARSSSSAMMSAVPPVSIAAIGTPSALASISTRLRDSGPRDGKISIDACASQAAAVVLIDPADQPDVARRACRGRRDRPRARDRRRRRPAASRVRRAFDDCRRGARVPLFGASLPR